MSSLPSLSIRSKVSLIVMTTTCVALLVTSVTLGVFDQLAFRSRMGREALTRAQIIANTCATALSLGDARPTEELLRDLSADPHLGAAAVLDVNGRVFAQFIRPRWAVPLPSKLSIEEVTFGDHHLEVSQPVQKNGRSLGGVVLQTDLMELRERRARALWLTLLVLVASSGVSFLLATGLQRFISQPLADLSQTARSVAVEKNYSIRVPKRSEDELGRLVDSFNEMLVQIETRDTALGEAQLELEQRVSLRTRELYEANERLQIEVGAHKRARTESDALREKLQAAYERVQREAEDRVAVQEALRRSEERFSKAFRASPVPLAILTRRSRAFVDVNDRFAELVGTKRDEIIGSAMFSVPLWSVPETRARLEQLLADGQSLRHWDCRVTGAGNETRSALLSAESVVLGDEPCVLLMTEDISERVNLEGQLRQAQKMDAIGQLASGVAHDFNNLLTIIQGYTQIILAQQPAGGMVREALAKVVSASQRAAQLTGQLLTFSRKQIAQPKPIELNQIVTNVAGMLRPLLGENIRLQWNPAAALPPIEGDPGMLEQVLVNLAVNARDAMPRGGNLVITTFACEIDAAHAQSQPASRPGHFVCLQVSDSGCGMDAPTLERIFEPFFTTKGVGKGTGLGLATAYGIVKQHHGWIEIASQIGHGTTFKIFLPAAAARVATAANGSEPGELRGGNELILVVEDEPVLRELVTQVLRRSGYDVLEASHGPEAVRLWHKASRKPALLLTDMMMPEGMNGWELAERLRGEASGLKVVYTSGYSPELFGGHFKPDDSSNFLPKPFHPQHLTRTIRQCLDN